MSNWGTRKEFVWGQDKGLVSPMGFGAENKEIRRNCGFLGLESWEDITPAPMPPGHVYDVSSLGFRLTNWGSERNLACFSHGPTEVLFNDNIW